MAACKDRLFYSGPRQRMGPNHHRLEAMALEGNEISEGFVEIG